MMLWQLVNVVIVALALTLVLGAIAVALALLLVSPLEPLPRVSRTATRSFWCRCVERDVTVGFRKGLWGDRAKDVVCCTAFVPSTDITCGKPCLDVDNLARWKSAA